MFEKKDRTDEEKEKENFLKRCLLCPFSQFMTNRDFICRRLNSIKAKLVPNKEINEYMELIIPPYKKDLFFRCPNHEEENEDLNNSIKELLK